MNVYMKVSKLGTMPYTWQRTAFKVYAMYWLCHRRQRQADHDHCWRSCSELSALYTATHRQRQQYT